MSDNQTNHEIMDEQWNDLPVPDPDQAWQKMNALLDEEDKKRRLLPPVVLRSCALWGTLLLTGAAALWFFFTGDTNHIAGTVPQQKVQRSIQQPSGNSSSTPSASTITTQTSSSQNTPASNSLSAQPVTTKKNNVKEQSVITTRVSNHINSTVKANEPYRENNVVNLPSNEERPSLVTTTDKQTSNRPVAPVTKSNATLEGSNVIPNRGITNDVKQNTATPAASGDTAKKAVAEPEPVAAVPATKALKEKLFYFTAGIGEQQQIPVAGQSAFPYNYNVRKGSISDYIPSLYVRLHRAEQWFLQAEFRYGAPQSVSEFSFSRQTKYDAAGTNRTTTSQILKKTYYHQVPLSFNYYIAPHLSIGAGGVYSRFYGAITEEEIKSTNLQTQAETVSRKLIQVPHFTDSFLYKTQVHLLLQTDYQWKRISVGLRYKKDIQPYIKYTTPNGEINTEKNQALEFIMRFSITSPRPSPERRGRR